MNHSIGMYAAAQSIDPKRMNNSFDSVAIGLNGIETSTPVLVTATPKQRTSLTPIWFWEGREKTWTTDERGYTTLGLPQLRGLST